MLEFLVDVRSDERDTAHLRFAFDLARRFGAHLTGMQVIALDASVIALPEPLLVLEDEENVAHERHGWWASACRSRGIDGTWEVRRGVHRRVLVRRASLCDVLIGRLHVPGSGIPAGTGLLARVLMSRVSPMILVPDEAAPSAMRRILVAWNGSAVSARAIRAALPFLSRARNITILAGDREGRPRRDDADLLLRAWLQRHALVGDWIEMAGKAAPAEAIAGCAETTRADAVVMGAWGRSRLREMALGGTTRHMLAHGRVPIFLSA
ncbi:universal stress protein [Luteibacter yeojuensis]|uniref:Universal stress protein n=1 Tax=Luteibacter yeojuensis TaxID=345309 RepID=A0A7X5QSH1_9GAMM|nr:universal stress protein [Luteibacter yeojuensis]NID14617.1 universal stress protein [Luteibacter yeojuensis]